MTDRWYQDMALSRIGPDTGELARHIQVTAAGHLRGCLCPECSDLRRAVGGHRMDKHIAKTMAARERGKTRAGRIIIAQRHREGAARAQVTRELAGWGAYPYRTSGRRDLLAEADAAVAKIEARCGNTTAERMEQLAAEDWGSWHEPGCGCGCEKPWKPPETIDQVYAEADARGADPVWQWQEVTRSIILPDYGQLITLVPDQPPGTCKDCRTGPLFAGNQCWYCSTRDELKAAQPAPGHRLLLLVVLHAGLLLWMVLVLILVLT